MAVKVALSLLPSLHNESLFPKPVTACLGIPAPLKGIICFANSMQMPLAVASVASIMLRCTLSSG